MDKITEQRMTTAFIRLMALVAAVYFFARLYSEAYYSETFRIVTVLFTAQPVVVLLLIGFVVCFGLFLDYGVMNDR